MKVAKVISIIILLSGVVLQGFPLFAEEILEIQDETVIFPEPTTLEEELMLLPETTGLIDLEPEVAVNSQGYDRIVSETLTEEEVLEALGALSMSERAVERGLAVYIAGSYGVMGDILRKALSDPDEAVRGEALFYLPKIFAGVFAEN